MTEGSELGEQVSSGDPDKLPLCVGEWRGDMAWPGVAWILCFNGAQKPYLQP